MEAPRVAAALELREVGGAVAVGIGSRIGGDRRIQSEPRLPRARHAVAVGIAVEDVEVGQTVDVVGNHRSRLEEGVAAVRC